MIKQIDPNPFQSLQISKDPIATIMIEDLTQQLQISDQKCQYYQGENKALTNKLQKYQLKYKGSQTKKKQINTMQNDLQDLYKSNMSTLEAMLTDAQFENNISSKKNQEMNHKVSQLLAQVQDLQQQNNNQLSKIQGLVSENVQLNLIIADQTKDKSQQQRLVNEQILQMELKSTEIGRFQNEIDKHETLNDNLEAQIEELNSKAIQQNSSLEILVMENRHLKEIIQDKEEEITALNQQLHLLVAKNKNLFNDNSNLTMRVTKQQDQLDMLENKVDASFTTNSSASHTTEQFQSLEFLLDQERTRMQLIRESYKHKQQAHNGSETKFELS